MNKILPLLIISGLVVLFQTYPEMDLSISSLFYDSETQSFKYADYIFVKILFFLIQATLVCFALGICFSGLKKLLKYKSVNPKFYRPELFIGLTAVIGPGLFVHEFLKKFVGRPRPQDIICLLYTSRCV